MTRFAGALLLSFIGFTGTPSLSARPVPMRAGVAPDIRTIFRSGNQCAASSAMTGPFAAARALQQQALGFRHAVAAAVPGRFLPDSRTVDASANVTLDVTLPEGFLITGTITPTGPETPSSITASDGLGNSFSGTIDASNAYRIVVPAGSYSLMVCFQVTVGFLGGPTITYGEATPVDATAGDATRDITLPGVVVQNVQGKVLGTDPAKTSLLNFVSADNTVGTTVFLDPSGSYGDNPFLPVALPVGTYTVALNQLSGGPGPFSFSTFVLGTLTVAGPGALPDLTKPATTKLFGRVLMSDGTAAPDGTIVTAADVGAPPPSALACFNQPSNAAFATADPVTGAYEMEVVAGTYRPFALIQVLPATGAQSEGRIGVTAGDVVVSGPTMQDISAPPLPTALSNVSGLVSGGPDPLADVGVGASTQLAPNTVFLRSTKTGVDGRYAVDVYSATPYKFTFTP